MKNRNRDKIYMPNTDDIQADLSEAFAEVLFSLMSSNDESSNTPDQEEEAQK